MEIVGIDGEKVSPWFEDNIPGVELPLTFELIAGGRSNLTFRVTDAAGHDYCLRRPPTSHVLPTPHHRPRRPPTSPVLPPAHDMGREFRIIDALGPTPVPVAKALGFCEDESVNDKPFYIMDYVDGHVLRDAATAEKVFTEEQRRTAGEHLIDVLAD